MATPILEHIAQFLEDSINSITVANGFNYTLSAVRNKRMFLEDEPFADKSVYIWQDESENLGQGLSTTSKRKVDQEYIIWAIGTDDDDATVSIDTKLNKIRADIEKKLCEDPTCGGYAKHLDIVSTMITDEPETGVVILIRINYIIQWNNPYIIPS